jgi:hypothetical protein
MQNIDKYVIDNNSEFFTTDEVGFDIVTYVSDLISEFENYTDISYPIYVPSKGRADCAFTPQTLKEENIPYKLFVEPQDFEEYSKYHDIDTLVNIENDDKGISYVRNFIKNYSKKQGDEYHWQLDDDIKHFRIRMNDRPSNKNVKVKGLNALSIVEKTVNLFSNVGISGLTSSAFAFSKPNPIKVNQLAYSCVLINNNIDLTWDEKLSGVEDWHYTLTLLEKGLCTLSFSHILFEAPSTSSQKGGNMTHWENKEKRRKLYERFVKIWPKNFRLLELGETSTKGYKLQHVRRFFLDYKKQTLKLKK